LFWLFFACNKSFKYSLSGIAKEKL
jgi:hypothetical protein